MQSGLTRQSVFDVDFKLHQKIDNTTGQIIAGEYILTTSNNDYYRISWRPRTLASGISEANIHIITAYSGRPGLPATQSQPAISDNILTRIDNALTQVNDFRSTLGATENRLAATIDNLGNSANHLQAARSRIQDADFAWEVASLTKTQILQQMATSVLMLANQSAQTVLTLLH